jgi:phage antirepressor YoqD-like protein
MENELKVTGKQTFMGIEIPVIEGGFGEDKRIVTAKTISEIHNIEIKEITKSINRLISKNRIKENVDYVDIISQVNTLPMNLEEVFGIKPAYLSRTQNAFILSERGYSKLIKAMDDDKSWDVMDQFIDEYFDMRKVIKTVISERTLAIAGIVDAKTDVERAVAISDFEKVITQPLVKVIEEQKPLAALAELRIDKKGCYSLTDVTKTLGLKKGQITRWAKSKEYIHKKLSEVNQAGEQFFKVYSSDGVHNSIGIKDEGLQEINMKLEEIKTY